MGKRSAGRPVIEWTLAAFQNHPGVDSITIAAGESEIERLQETATRFSKVTGVVVGRRDSRRIGSERPQCHSCTHRNWYWYTMPPVRLVGADVIDRVIEATAQKPAQLFRACLCPIP